MTHSSHRKNSRRALGGGFYQLFLKKFSLPSPRSPSSIQSCPTAADTSVAAGMKGLPGLACTPSISFLSGGEMLWAFHLCKRSYMTMSFHQIWFQKSNNDGSSYYSIIISTKLYVALLRPRRRETTHACAFLAAGPLPAWIRHTAYSWWYFKDSATKGACF